MIVIGTAGWSIPRAVAGSFHGDGSHLQRYARVLRGTEINSSFYRPHARAVYERWAASTPPDFRFAVKLPRAITHEGELRRARGPLRTLLQEQVAGLGAKLGPLLVQLPPSAAFNPRVARSFFATLRELHAGPVVCEPRHPSWFEARAHDLLVAHRIARVATDPTSIPGASTPGGWMGGADAPLGAIVYYRLHGSPRKYWSRYEHDRLSRWAAELNGFSPPAEAWCIFDNTASGAAAENALQLTELIRRGRTGR